MSYSQDVKSELCSLKLHCENCEKSMLYGFLLFIRGLTENYLSFSTDSRAVASFTSEAIAAISGAIVTVTAPDLQKNKRRQFTVCVNDKDDIKCLLKNVYDYAILDKHSISTCILKSECCTQAFLRGAFLACGSISNPKNEYHLEFSTVHCVLADMLCKILNDHGFDFKTSFRVNTSIHTAYIKDSEGIADTLTYLGAVKESLNIMNLKIEKELRNNANRITNCETANIDKTVNASLKQIEKINKLKKSNEYEFINANLKEVAELRLDNPDMSLRELTEMFNGTLSRSGLNHRLNKLCELADKLN